MDAAVVLGLRQRYGWTAAEVEAIPAYLLPVLLADH